MNTPQICCDSCDTIYSLSDPILVNGVPRIGDKVSTEVGCPKCLSPDGVIVEDISIVVCRCTCGWFDYFFSRGLSPATCPQCSKDFVIRSLTSQDEIIYPAMTLN